jgi:regulator of protease activity HflC (stomatin/prohibitin superfamily)
MTFNQRLRQKYIKHRSSVLIVGFVFFFVTIILLPSVLIFVDAGKAGVRNKRFGGGVETSIVYGEGTHLIWPWDKMTIYDVRVNQIGSRFNVIASNGLTIQVEISIRYYPTVGHLGLLHKEIGTEYVQRIVIPEVQSSIRKLLGRCTPQQVYQTQNNLTLLARSEATQKLKERFIVLDNLLIQSIELPPSIQSAIQSKLIAEQASEEMHFRLEREVKEKDRKFIEAEGISRYNDIIKGSLSREILEHKSIEAFLELAKSGNSNTIVFGSPSSLPMVMDVGNKLGSVSKRGPEKVPADPKESNFQRDVLRKGEGTEAVNLDARLPEPKASPGAAHSPRGDSGGAGTGN